jgi:hypothetical protein
MFTAPSREGGKVAFQAGEREKDAQAAATEEALPDAAEERKPSKEERKPSKPKKGGKAADEPPPAAEVAAPEIPSADIGGTRLDDGVWHHVAVTFRSGRIYAFADGRPDGDAGMEVVASPLSPLLMGAEADHNENGDASHPPEGLMDVQVYSSALSDDQILGLATESKDLPSGMILPLTPWQVKDFWQLHAKPEDGGQRSEARALASECLGLGKDACRSFQDEVICDFFVSLLEYAQSICLTARKTAVFVGIMQFIFTSMFRRSKTSACVGEPFSSSECFLEYKRLILDHAATAAGALSTAPPRRLQIFSTGEVKRLTEYVSGTLFQHFFLYQCVLVNPQDANISYASAKLEAPRCPPVLRKAKLLPPKQEPGVATLRKPYPGDADGQSDPSQDPAGVSVAGSGPTGYDAEGGKVGDEAAADATQLLGRVRTSTPGGSGKEEDHLEFLVAEASKAVHEHVEASIQASDELLFKK